MAKISRQVREIINIVLFFVIIGVVITAYVIYPLNRTKNTMGRADMGEFNFDSLPANDPSPFFGAGLAADTFRLEIEEKANDLVEYISLYLGKKTVDEA